MSAITGFEWLEAINRIVNSGNKKPVYDYEPETDDEIVPIGGDEDSYEGDLPIWEDIEYESESEEDNNDGFFIGEELSKDIIETITSTNITLKEYLERVLPAPQA